MKIVGLFAGIGGLETGFARAGHETSLLCEVWEPARHVLRNRIEAELHDDVATLRALPSGTEVLVGGFPCQDLSQAGLTAGIDGARSSLVNHVFRLLERRRIPLVVLENVSFMLHLDKGRALARLVDAFEARGYRWAYRVVNSLAFVPQRRERVLLVASRCEIDPADIVLSDDVDPVKTEYALNQRAHGFYWTEGVRGLGWASDSIPTLKNGSTVGIASPPAILLPDGAVITPDIRDAEKLQGFPPDWTAPAVEVARPTLRWSLIGNAVTVPVAAWLGERIATPGRYDRGRDRDITVTGKWPRAARFDGRQRIGVVIGAFPTWAARPPLAKFLAFPGKPLSARATRGFLGRTRVSRLRFKPEFLEALRAHLLRVEHGEATARAA